MRLSEAIMLGAGEITLSNATWFYGSRDTHCHGCLVGSALFAMGYKPTGESLPRLNKEWPWTKEIVENTACPICSAVILEPNYGFATMLTELMTHYLKGECTIEQIADYVRSVEPSEPNEIVDTSVITETECLVNGGQYGK